MQRKRCSTETDRSKTEEREPGWGMQCLPPKLSHWVSHFYICDEARERMQEKETEIREECHFRLLPQECTKPRRGALPEWLAWMNASVNNTDPALTICWADWSLPTVPIIICVSPSGTAAATCSVRPGMAFHSYPSAALRKSLLLFFRTLQLLK